MTRAIVDDVLRSKLHNLTEPLELCDPSGIVLGHLVPTCDLSNYEPWIPEFSDEELRLAEQSDEKCCTTAVLLAHLASLEKP